MLRGQQKDNGHLDKNLADISYGTAILGHPENNEHLERVESAVLQENIAGQNTILECTESSNTSLAFADSEDSTNTSAPLSPSNASSETSLAAYLNKLVKVAQSRPKTLETTQDVTILTT